MTARKHIILGSGLCLIAILFVSPVVRAGDMDFQSRWAPQGITLDGQRSDWPDGSTSYLDDKGIVLGVCNDSQHMYVLLCFKDEMWAHMIKHSGLTVWLDPDGKKKKDFMVRLTGGPSREEMMKVSGRTPGQMQRQMPLEMEEQLKQHGWTDDTMFVCFQKDHIVEKQIPTDGKEGPAAAFGIDKGFFVYELAVPLTQSSALFYGISAKPKQNVSVGLIWGDLDRGKIHSKMTPTMGDGPGFGGGGGGMGGRTDGGMGGGGMRGGDNPNRQMPKKQEIWFKAALAESQAAPSK